MKYFDNIVACVGFAIAFGIALAPIAWVGPAALAARAAVITPLVLLGIVDQHTAESLVVY